MTSTLATYGNLVPADTGFGFEAGGIRGRFVGGEARYLRLGDAELVHGIAVILRDPLWGTIVPIVHEVEVASLDGSLDIRFAIRYDEPWDLTWQGVFRVDPDGSASYAVHGVAGSKITVNRAGICVFHPISFAGRDVTIGQPGGSVETHFPTEIAPQQPFERIREMRWSAGAGMTARLNFEGALFETEDQRNWTDASFKTFCPPLADGFPFTLGRGQEINQRVTLTLDRGPGRPGKTTATSRQPRQATHQAQISVTNETVGRLPSLGTSVDPVATPPGSPALEAIRHLHPAHLRVALDLRKRDWRKRFLKAAEIAEGVGARLELEVVRGSEGASFGDLARVVIPRRERIARVLVFDDTGLATTRHVAAEATEALAARGVVVGGGSRGHFADLNRAAIDGLDLAVIGYPITPQAHAFDHRSVIETIEIHEQTARQAVRIGGARPVVVGPITLLPPRSIVPAGTKWPPDFPEPDADPRQTALFAAAWTIGSLAALAAGGAASATYFEAFGSKGLLRGGGEEDIELFPVYHVLASVHGRWDVLRTSGPDDPDVRVLALRRGNRVRVLVANLHGHPMSIDITLPRLEGGTIIVLDAQNVSSTTRSKDLARSVRPRAVPRTARPVGFQLGPMAIARLDGRLP